MSTPLTEAEFANLVGVTRAKVRQLADAGVLVRTGDGRLRRESVRRYCAALRAQALSLMNVDSERFAAARAEIGDSVGQELIRLDQAAVLFADYLARKQAKLLTLPSNFPKEIRDALRAAIDAMIAGPEDDVAARACELLGEQVAPMLIPAEAVSGGAS